MSEPAPPARVAAHRSVIEQIPSRLLDRIYFAHNRSDVTGARTQLEAVARLALQAGNEGMVLIITGHADAAERTPLQLSLQRVSAVYEYLVQRGVPGTRMKVEALGDRKPSSPAHAPGVRNQRVEIHVVGR